MIIAKTIKGKGVSFIEDKNGWHGKVLDKERLDQALKELGPVDKSVRGNSKPEDRKPRDAPPGEAGKMDYPPAKPLPRGQPMETP